MALSFQQKLIFSTNRAVTLCRGADKAGQAFFHYIVVDRRGFETMQRDYNTGKVVDFKSYGDIVHSGWGEPTDEDQALANQLANAA